MVFPVAFHDDIGGSAARCRRIRQTRRKRAHRKRARVAPRLSLESLETRQLLAGDVVTVADKVTVQQNSDWVPVDVLSNDLISPDYDGAFEVTAVSDGSQGGQVRLRDDSSLLEYRPSVGISGSETFSYIVDGAYIETVTVTISSPLEKDAYEFVQASGERKLHLLENDRFFNGYLGDRLISDVSATSSGATVRIAEDGKSVLYSPVDTYVGYDSFRYLVDGQFESQVTVYIGRPVQDDHRNEVERNSTDRVIYPLENDYWYRSLSNDRTKIVTEITAVSETENGGTVTVSADGQSVSYTPPADYVGPDSFEYIADGKYQARVSVNVTRPVRDDRFTVLQTSENNTLNVRANDFLSNAYTGDRLITAVDNAENGAVSISDDGRRLSYTPNEDFVGRDRFTYTIDGDLTATVSVGVDALAKYDSYDYGVNPTVSSYVLSPLDNDYFGEAGYTGLRQITSVTDPSSGTVEILSGNRLRYTPADGAPSYVTFDYTVDDRFTSSVSVHLSGYLSGDSLVVKQNSASNVINVLTNDDFDPDWGNIGPYQGPRLITNVSETDSGGIVTVGTDLRSLRYTPVENFVGTESFTYTVDGVQSATVWVNVTSYARDDRYRVDPGSSGKSLHVLANDRSDRRMTKRIDRVGASTQGGVATVAADGQSIHYQPVVGFEGTDTFHYYLVDGSRAEVTVEVTNSVDELLPRFIDHADMGAFLTDDAVERYQHLFGTEYYEWVFDAFPNSGGDFFDASTEQRVSSETNVHVAGVDEGDIIEVDSDYLYVLTDDSLLIVDAWPAEEINEASRTLIDGTPLVEYLDGDRLTVVSDTSVRIQDEETPNLDAGRVAGDFLIDSWWPYPYGTLESSVTVTVYDLSDRTAPTIIEQTKYDGKYSDSRAINGFVYVVLQDEFKLPEPETHCAEIESESGSRTQCFYETQEQYVARVNENIGSLIDESLPHYSSYGENGEFIRGGLLAEASEIFRPTFDEHGEMLIVTSISMLDDEIGPIASAAIPMSSTTQIYASLDNLYVFGTDAFSDYDPATNILKFNWNGETGGLDFASTGLLPGQLHGGNSYGGYLGDIWYPTTNSGTGAGQFSIDEYDGHLRIATTTRGLETGETNWRSSSDIYVLSDNGGIIETAGSLQDMTPDETIKSVRFMGDRAFVVTFNTSDPLLAIDFSNPTVPTEAGYLLLPGFSSYMQPLSENLIVGLGKNTPNGHSGPSQLSLFDVSDLSNPVRVDQYTWDHWSTSEAALDHHAFGFFAHHSIITIPIGSSRWVREDTDGDGFLDDTVHYRNDDLYAFRYDEAGTIEELGQVSHDWTVRRSGFIDDRLYSVSTNDVIVSDINAPSTEYGRLEFGARMTDPEPTDPIVVLEAARTPSPLDDLPVLEILDATRNHLASELEMAAGQISTVTIEGEFFPTACHYASVRDACFISLTAGYEMVLDAAGTRYLYTATSANDIVMREAAFDFNVARGTVQNAALANDANNDGVVSPIDALLVINALGRKSSSLRLVDRDYVDPLYADVNGDGAISPIDALNIINALGSSVAAQAAPLPVSNNFELDNPAETDIRLHSVAVVEISDELDTLVNQRGRRSAVRKSIRFGHDAAAEGGYAVLTIADPTTIVDELWGAWQV